MDVDGQPQPVNAPNTADVEASLLQQFNCLGTTDHDELIGQMQQLMGVTYRTALFFLDMNNWNLQAAVCSYLDLNVDDGSGIRNTSPSLPSDQLVLAHNVPLRFPSVSFNEERLPIEGQTGIDSNTQSAPEMSWNGMDLRGAAEANWRGETSGEMQMDPDLGERMSSLQPAPPFPPPPDRPAC